MNIRFHLNQDEENRLCYIKNGDVVNELKTVLNYKGDITGGNDYFVYSVIKALSEKWKLLIISSLNRNKIYCEKSYCAKTIRMYFKRNKSIGFLFTILPLFKIFINLFQFHPTKIICVKSSSLIPVFLYSKLFSIPYAVSVHTDIEIMKNHLIKIILIFLIKKSNFVICHGPHLHSQIQRIATKKLKIVEFDVSCNDLKNMIDKNCTLNLPKYKKIISCIGRMEEEKGVVDLYIACRKLLRKDNSFLLVYTGKGYAKTKIQNLINQDKMEDSVLILGDLNRKKIANLINQSYLIITPTRSTFPEGRCMSGMESLALGIPLIAPRFGPFEYLIDDYVNGLFYIPDSIESLQNKIKEALNPVIRNKLSKGSKSVSGKYLKNTFGYDNAVKSFIKLYGGGYNEK